MSSNARSYSNPIYDIVDKSNLSFTRPLMINIEPTSSFPSSHAQQIPLLLLANCFTSPLLSSQHNYVNQRIEEIIDDADDENLDPLYAKPRKRCVTLSDEPLIIPNKTSRFSMKSIKAERAQLISTTIPAATVLSSTESTDEIDQFIARENDRLERVKLRRRPKKTTVKIVTPSEKSPAAFSNPNYVEMPRVNDTIDDTLTKSILV